MSNLRCFGEANLQVWGHPITPADRIKAKGSGAPLVRVPCSHLAGLLYNRAQGENPMNVLVIDGYPQGGSADVYLAEVQKALERKRHQVTVMRLREMVIAECQRCHGCWVQSPGECKLPDESESLRTAFVKSDVAVLASPLLMGYPSALLQRAIDRLVPLLLPYWQSAELGMRHQARHDQMPKLGLLLGPEEDMDTDDISIVHALFDQVAIQLSTQLRFVLMTDVSASEVANEIHRL